MYNIDVIELTKKIYNYDSEFHELHHDIESHELHHDIEKPKNELPSVKIKNITDGVLTFNYYKDLDTNNKNNIKKIFKKQIYKKSFTDTIKEINLLSKKYKYFIQTDLMGAFFNFSFENIFKTLNYINNEYVFNYISGFYKYIKENYELHEYLYISNYSEYIFTLFLQNIFKNQNIIFKMDDIILYGDDMSKLLQTFKNLSKTLSQYSLYFNPNKTFYINTFYDSIYIFETIVSTPHNNILDNRLKKKIMTLIKNEKTINIYSMTDQLYNYFLMLPRDIKIEVYNDINIFKKTFYGICCNVLNSINIYNDITYIGIGINNLIIKSKEFGCKKKNSYLVYKKT